VATDRANQMWGRLCATLKAAEVSAVDRLRLWESVEAAVRAIVAEREPLRVGPEEVRLFGDELEMAAAKERARVEGLPWGDVEPDLDADSDRVPLLFAIDGSVNGRG
jgi:hypothetical protein